MMINLSEGCDGTFRSFRGTFIKKQDYKISIMKDAIREAIKELLIPELNEIKASGYRLEGRVDEISSRIGDTNLQIVELGRRVDETNNRIDETNNRIGETNNRIDAVREELTKRIDTINADITAHMDAQTARIDSQTARIDVLSEHVSELRMDFAEFKGREKLIEDLTGRVNRLESKVIA